MTPPGASTHTANMASKSRGKGAGVQLNLFGKVSTRAHHVIYPNAKSVYEKFINAYCGLEGNVKTKQQVGFIELLMTLYLCVDWSVVYSVATGTRRTR